MMSDPEYTIEEMDEMMDNAYNQGVHDALEKAAKVAEKLGDMNGGATIARFIRKLKPDEEEAPDG